MSTPDGTAVVGVGAATLLPGLPVPKYMQFDTHGGANAAQGMREYIASIPNGRVVLVAVMDEASRHAGSGSYEALGLLGGSVSTIGMRASYALIGRKGGASALAEMHDGGKAVTVSATTSVAERIVVRGAGWYSPGGGVAEFYLGNGIKHEVKASRGFNVLELDEKLRASEHKTFDTHGSADAATSMRDYIAQIPNGRIVLVAARDEASNKAGTAAYEALGQLGAKVTSLVHREGYALIGRKGASSPLAEVRGMSVVQAEAVVEAPRSIEVHSAGWTVGNTASFKMDGVALPVPLGRGFVVVDLSADPAARRMYSEPVPKYMQFDTHGGANAAQGMREYIASIPNGRVVLVAVMDEASRHAGSGSYEALGLLGGSVSTIGMRASYALIGRKGGASALAEMHDGGKAVTVSATTSVAERIVVRGAGWYSPGGGVAEFYLGNGIKHEVKASRGFNVLELDEKLRASEHKTFDTHGSADAATSMRDYIAQIPNGRIVLVAARDEASNKAGTAAYEALGQLGAKVTSLVHREGYALIGRKGASSPLAEVRGMSVVQAEAVVEAPRSIEVHSAGWTVGNTASFKMDGVTLPVPLGRGFVVVELGQFDPVVNTAVDISEQETALGRVALAKRLLVFHAEVAASPIRGCFDDKTNPLVSLKDALTSQASSLADFMYTCKLWLQETPTKEAIKNVPNLSDDGAMSIWMYTAESPLYTNLNDALRALDRNALKRSYFPYLRLLLTALNAVRDASKSKKPRMVNRGVPLDLNARYPDKYKVDKLLVWWGISSCTTDIGVLKDDTFLGVTGERTIFQIQTSCSIDVSPFSAIKAEKEVVLPPGFALKITGMLPMADGLTIFTCEDDDDAPELVT